MGALNDKYRGYKRINQSWKNKDYRIDPALHRVP